jgi:hypothetical protein
MTKTDWIPEIRPLLVGPWAWSTDGRTTTSYMELRDGGECGLLDLNMVPLNELAFCYWDWEWNVIPDG